MDNTIKNINDLHMIGGDIQCEIKVIDKEKLKNYNENIISKKHKIEINSVSEYFKKSDL